MEDNNMGDLRQAIHDEAKWTETWNGCDTLNRYVW